MKKEKMEKKVLIRRSRDVTASIRDPAGGCSSSAADRRRFVQEAFTHLGIWIWFKASYDTRARGWSGFKKGSQKGFYWGLWDCKRAARSFKENLLLVWTGPLSNFGWSFSKTMDFFFYWDHLNVQLFFVSINNSIALFFCIGKLFFINVFYFCAKLNDNDFSMWV